MTATHTLDRVDGWTVLSIAGELDLTNAEDMFGWISAAIDGPDCEGLRIDLRDVHFIDSIVVRYLIQAHAYARSSAVPLKVVNAQGLVYRVLWTTGVAGVLGMA